MKLARAALVPYRLPLARPVKTADTALVRREGWLLRLEDAAGRVGWGEAAPWPGLGGGPAGTERDLEALADALPAGDLDREAIAARSAGLAPEAAFAWETAALDLLGQAEGVALGALLGVDPLPERVAIHALVASAVEAQDAVRDGATTLKVKIGADTLEADDVRVAAIRAAVGLDVALRLDANGAWRGDAAVFAARRFAAQEPEWLEQPVPPADLDLAARIRRDAGVAVALDESLAARGLEAVLAAEAADVIVVKPALAGGLVAARALAAGAAAVGLRVCVTSVLEGAIGRAAALHLAAALPPAARVAAGLGGAHLTRDHARLAGDRAGLAVPAGPGLGVAPDERTDATGGGGGT